MTVAANADDYTNGRVNIFFPANNSTSANGNLTGQCVTLEKWFTAEMCTGFPSPFAARGDARYVGQTLVAQGLAVEVPYDQRRRGDIVCLEYGQYGHIYVQLSGGRVFEENIKWSGVASEVVDGATVYASRIGSENESWRAGKNPHVYRLNSYKEITMATDALTKEDIIVIYDLTYETEDSQVTEDIINAYTGKPLSGLLTQLHNDPTWLAHKAAMNNPPGFTKVNTPLYTKDS